MLLRGCLAIRKASSPSTTAMLARPGMRFGFGHCRVRMEQRPHPSPLLGELVQEQPQPGDNPLAALGRHFNIARRNGVPLFKDLDTYRASLPVRLHKGTYLRLHELEHWVCDEDLQAMADRLEAEPKGGIRSAVKYLAAPGASGKTCSVLPAFLKSAAKKGGFTHYLYIAFDNNNERRFTLLHKPSSNKAVAEKQGAASIFEVIKILVDRPDKQGPYEITLKKQLPSAEQTRKDMAEYIQAKFGSECKLLIHVDEHRKMCGVHFSRGALETLAYVPNVTVVATYTQQPPLPATNSSGVRRFAVALPCLDINQVMRRFPQLSFDTHGLTIESNRELRRLWATLRFRLALKLRDLGLGGLHRPGTSKATEEFLAAFQDASREQKPAGALKQCIHLCKISFGTYTKLDPNALRLLLGVDEKELSDTIERQASDLVVLGDMYTASLMHLLNCDTKDTPAVYNVGRNRLLAVLTGGAKDYLAATPLEAAYTWTLSCRASVQGELKFGNTAHPIVCERVRPGRIFHRDDDGHFDLSKLQRNTVYYAHENTAAGLSSHPLADIFFRTSEDDFVLIDVTGGMDADTKARKLANWITKAQEKVAAENNGGKLYGVVLAPLAPGRSTQTNAQVAVVRGEDALQLLGGLRHVFRWL